MLSKLAARHADRFAGVVVEEKGVEVALSLFSVPHIRAEGVALLSTLLANSKAVAQVPALQRFGRNCKQHKQKNKTK